MAQRPVLLFGKWSGNPDGNIRVTGLSGNAAYNKNLNVSSYVPSEANAALRYLWARFRIQLLDDYASVYYDPDSMLIKEITRLGIRYNLLTAYTSFIAIDSLIRRDTGDVITVKQPLPMPEGVSDYAVGESMGWGAMGTSYASTGQRYLICPMRQHIVTAVHSWNIMHPIHSRNIHSSAFILPVMMNRNQKALRYSTASGRWFSVKTSHHT